MDAYVYHCWLLICMNECVWMWIDLACHESAFYLTIHKTSADSHHSTLPWKCLRANYQLHTSIPYIVAFSHIHHLRGVRDSSIWLACHRTHTHVLTHTHDRHRTFMFVNGVILWYGLRQCWITLKPFEVAHLSTI